MVEERRAATAEAAAGAAAAIGFPVVLKLDSPTLLADAALIAEAMVVRAAQVEDLHAPDYGQRAISLLFLVRFLPLFFMSPFAGVIADHLTFQFGVAPG